MFICPSNGGQFSNEIGTAAFGMTKGNYRACVGSGDMYGSQPTNLTGTGPWGPGVFSVTPNGSYDPVLTAGFVKMSSVTMGSISDGTSNTAMLSEALTGGTSAGWGGPMGAYIYGNMGGGLYSHALTPNSTAADRPIGPCPRNQGDTSYRAPCLSLGGNAWWTRSAINAHTAARSLHGGGGVNITGIGQVKFAASSEEMMKQAEQMKLRGDDSGLVAPADQVPPNAKGNREEVEIKVGSQELNFDLKKPASRPEARS